MNRSKNFGKIKKRLEEIKNKWAKLTKVDFSYNESARLATDALLDGGTEAYQKVLNEEGEVDFLSLTEVQYIKDNMKEPYYANENHSENDKGSTPNGNTHSESYYPMNSDSSEPSTPLHNWSTEEKPYLKDKSSATVYFQNDKTNNIRESIRKCIHRTSQALAVLMDEFTDAEIFCDILEAANKRNVFVYLLLDVTKLKQFTQMCEKLQVKDVHLKNVSIRSATGDVYCGKSGRKFAGQIHEKFIISDWRCVLSGSYSFTWLSGQVHRNFLYKFTGHVVELFDEEFRHLYGSSKPVMGLKSPAPMAPVLKRDNSSSITDSSTHESINTTSEPFSNSSAASVPRVSQRPTSPVYTAPVQQAPLQRMNSFHGYSNLRSPPPQISYQPNYYQRNYMPESPTHFFNNNANIYRSMRIRQDDFTTSRFNQGWRPFANPRMT
ncbi:protein FAM83A [Bombina bombina]|uniref:protein FAM83A n=1 Tax=Bombina bombina TaxID=8345 RepID=UPI00235B1C78|nr:protein FAM83A [Bombina bombina]